MGKLVGNMMFYVVLVLPGGDTGQSCKFCNSFVEHSFLFLLIEYV